MADFHFKYGSGYQEFSFPDDQILGVIEPNKVEIPEGTEEEKVEYAIDHPMGTPTLDKIVKAGETVCIIVPDTTRQWGRPFVDVKILVDKLNKLGIPDSDITIISATGTHHAQTPEMHAAIVGQEIYDRIGVQDHDCKNNLVKVGTSTFGNDIYVNKTAMECDHRFIIGPVVNHLLAGYGGSRKYVLPGIAGWDTIMRNHKKWFASDEIGSGSNPMTAPGVYKGNPISDEMFEAAEFAKIDMNITNVVDVTGKIAFCYAGDLHKSHEAAVEKCRALDNVEVDEPGDLVIASAMGFPKDINLYQTTAKPITNAVGVLAPKKDSVLIVASECREGIGSPDMEKLLIEMDTAEEREIYTRKNYTIGLNVAYMISKVAEEYTLIVVSSLDSKWFERIPITPAKSITEAIEIAKKLTGKDKFKAYMMPFSANTCAKVKG
jgi:nickel-dependent lactate racemase